MRALYLSLGLFFVALGFVGAVLPVLPTTPFLIVAAACFTRSSPRLEAWLLNNPTFGPLLVDWRARGAIPWRAKIMALIGCAFGYIVFMLGSAPTLLPALAVALLMATGLIYVFSRPS